MNIRLGTQVAEKIKCPIIWLADLLTTDWLTGCLNDWLINGVNDYLGGCLLADCLIDWLSVLFVTWPTYYVEDDCIIDFGCGLAD
jgi:hypothetical protein